MFDANEVTGASCSLACGGGILYMGCNTQTGCNATTPTITNSAFSANTVDNSGSRSGGLYSNRTHTPTNGNRAVPNNIFWGNTSEYSSSFYS